MSDFEIKITGLEALQERLKAFTGKSARRIHTNASRRALRETRKKARANAKRLDDPMTAEQIARNVQVKINSKRFNSQGIISGRVGVVGGGRKGGTGKGGDTYYWRFLELGTSKIQARPFLRPAMNNQQIIDDYKKALDEAIDKEIKKYGAQ